MRPHINIPGLKLVVAAVLSSSVSQATFAVAEEVGDILSGRYTPHHERGNWINPFSSLPQFGNNDVVRLCNRIQGGLTEMGRVKYGTEQATCNRCHNQTTSSTSQFSPRFDFWGRMLSGKEADHGLYVQNIEPIFLNGEWVWTTKRADIVLEYSGEGNFSCKVRGDRSNSMWVYNTSKTYEENMESVRRYLGSLEISSVHTRLTEQERIDRGLEQ